MPKRLMSDKAWEKLIKKICELRSDGMSLAYACKKEYNGTATIDKSTFTKNVNKYDLKPYLLECMGKKTEHIESALYDAAIGTAVETIEEIVTHPDGTVIKRIKTITKAPNTRAADILLRANNPEKYKPEVQVKTETNIDLSSLPEQDRKLLQALADKDKKS